jgi:hypothetical protein
MLVEGGILPNQENAFSPFAKRSCENIQDWYLPARSVRRGTVVLSARSTQVERALRARFRL